ncbi:MAG: 3-deoxy-D-manno-octulosonic acid transferase [Candidatus Omnitrophota bacterium]
MLYDIGFAIFSLFYLPALIFKGKLHAGFAERFGMFSPDKRRALEDARGAIWIQAVSVGEVSVCKSLVSKLRTELPDKKIVISTITKTGNDLAKKLFSKDALILYFPLDFSPVVKKVVALIKPCMYVMIETEIWPNLLKELSAGGIPSILINGRISDRSIGKYMLARPFLKNTLGRPGRFSMQSGLDAERIISMGAPGDRVEVAGNMKFDVDIKADSKAMEVLREALSLKADEELFVAGSTHPGEEKVVIESFRELLKEFPKLKLLIAPRHVERAGEVEKLVKTLGFEPARLSNEHRKPNTENRIFILDFIGQMSAAYAAATIVYIGGSLVKHGGQNPIEPAIFGKPVLFGPYMFNFRDISAAFLKNNAAIRVQNLEEIVKNAKVLLKDRANRDEIGKLAKGTAIAGRGATGRNVEILKKYA